MANNLNYNSGYNNLSFINYEHNLLQVINSYSINEIVTITNFLSINNILYNFSLFHNISAIKIVKLMLLYNKHKYTIGTGYKKEIIRDIIKDFIYLVKTGTLNKVINFKYSKKKITEPVTGKISYTTYIIYNFNIKNLLKYSKSDPEFIKEEILDYVGAFYHFSILLLVSSFIITPLTEEEIINLFKDLSFQTCRGILTGFESYLELPLTCTYGAIYEELYKLEAKDAKVLSLTKNPEKQTLEFKILNNSIFKDRYEKYEGYANLLNTSFTKTYSTFKIVKGSSSNTLRLVFNKASGDELINWVLRIGDNEGKTHPNTLHEAGLIFIVNLMKFVFLSILDATNYSTADLTTNYTSYYKFIKNYNGEKYVAERVAVIVMLVAHPEIKNAIVNKFLTNKKQREELMKDVEKLKRYLRSKNESALKTFINTTVRSVDYVW